MKIDSINNFIAKGASKYVNVKPLWWSKHGEMEQICLCEFLELVVFVPEKISEYVKNNIFYCVKYREITHFQ